MIKASQLDVIRPVYFPAAQCNLLVREVIDIQTLSMNQSCDKDESTTDKREEENFKQWLNELCVSMNFGGKA